jgi:hypothetical protein
MNSENMKLIDKLSLTSRSVNDFIDKKNCFCIVLAWVNSPKFGGETGGNKGVNEAWEHIERAAANRAAGYVCMRVLSHIFMCCVSV